MIHKQDFLDLEATNKVGLQE